MSQKNHDPYLNTADKLVNQTPIQGADASTFHVKAPSVWDLVQRLLGNDPAAPAAQAADQNSK